MQILNGAGDNADLTEMLVVGGEFTNVGNKVAFYSGYDADGNLIQDYNDQGTGLNARASTAGCPSSAR